MRPCARGPGTIDPHLTLEDEPVGLVGDLVGDEIVQELLRLRQRPKLLSPRVKELLCSVRGRAGYERVGLLQGQMARRDAPTIIPLPP